MKALYGSVADARTFRLLEEVRSLRARVAALEEALTDAERALAERSPEAVIDLADARRVSLDEVEAATA